MTVVRHWTPPSAEALAAAMSMGDADGARQLSKQCLAEERDHYRQQLEGAVDRAEKAERALRVFQAGLTDALRAHNVPATPTWADAIHWLARHGGR